MRQSWIGSQWLDQVSLGIELEGYIMCDENL